MRRIGLLLVLLAAMATGTTIAQPDATSLQMLVEQQEALRAQLSDGGVDGVTPREARLIDKAQGEFFAIVRGKHSLDELGIEEKIRVENALETINAQIASTRFAADDQQVCWREVKVGSKMMVSRCASKKELEDEQESARKYLSKPRICVPPGCG